MHNFFVSNKLPWFSSIGQMQIAFCLVLCIAISCTSPIPEKTKATQKAAMITLPDAFYQKKNHEYGGWYCPDNIFGFPAVDLNDLSSVPVVEGRLPTEEETRNGTSLMYFDPQKHPDAVSVDMNLPRFARYYSRSTEKDEIVIVIQVVANGQDSVAGFRYLNGGNGSSWLAELEFMTEKDLDELTEDRFVTKVFSMDAPIHQVWQSMTDADKTNIWQGIFQGESSRASNWLRNSDLNIQDDQGKTLYSGQVTASWENLYLQIDYKEPHHLVEKIFLKKDPETQVLMLHLIAGPYGKDYDQKEKAWEAWGERVRVSSAAE